MTVIISECHYIHTHLGHQKCAISEHICTIMRPSEQRALQRHGHTTTDICLK